LTIRNPMRLPRRSAVPATSRFDDKQPKSNQSTILIEGGDDFEERRRRGSSMKRTSPTSTAWTARRSPWAHQPARAVLRPTAPTTIAAAAVGAPLVAAVAAAVVAADRATAAVRDRLPAPIEPRKGPDKMSGLSFWLVASFLRPLRSTRFPAGSAVQCGLSRRELVVGADRLRFVHCCVRCAWRRTCADRRMHRASISHVSSGNTAMPTLAPICTVCSPSSADRRGVAPKTGPRAFAIAAVDRLFQDDENSSSAGTGHGVGAAHARGETASQPASIQDRLHDGRGVRSRA